MHWNTLIFTIEFKKDSLTHLSHQTKRSSLDFRPLSSHECLDDFIFPRKTYTFETLRQLRSDCITFWWRACNFRIKEIGPNSPTRRHWSTQIQQIRPFANFRGLGRAKISPSRLLPSNREGRSIFRPIERKRNETIVPRAATDWPNWIGFRALRKRPIKIMGNKSLDNIINKRGKHGNNSRSRADSYDRN